MFCNFFTGLNLQRKEGYAYLNFCYADNAHYILSCLLHLLVRTEIVPFPRNLSLQFDNATNNKCNEEIGLFAHLVSEVCERFLFYVRISYFTTIFCLPPPPPPFYNNFIMGHFFSGYFNPILEFVNTFLNLFYVLFFNYFLFQNNTREKIPLK